MTPFMTRTTGYIFSKALAGLLLTLVLAMVPARLRADATSVRTHIKWTSTGWESHQSFQLEWPARSNATYLVQSATNLASGTWQTIDVVTPTNGAGILEIKGRSIPENSVEFFRLVLPQPQIFSVEPAVVAPGVAVAFYIVGQCFDTNMVLQINGVTQSDAVVQSSTTIASPSFTPDLPGSYQFRLMAGGAVVSSFNVVCADALANPELVLQGPPTEPPASPIAAWLSKRGYDYYQAQSDITFDVQEGKKGLNAVNVKFSRMAGGGGGGGRLNLFNAWPSAHHPPALAASIGGITAGAVAGIVIAARSDGKGDTSVIPFSGEVRECDVDMVIPGRGLDFVWGRTYHSRIGRTGAAANGWTFSYDVSVQPLADGTCVVRDGTGRADTFTLGPNGVYTCPEFFREGTVSSNTFTLTFADTGRWVFNPFDRSPAAGKLHQVITRNSDTMTLGYDPNGRLAQVVDDLDRTNTIAYTNDYVASVTDFTGRSVTYQYYQGLKADSGSAGDLKSVTSPPVPDFPAGKTTTYTYSKGSQLERENHLLLTVTDPKGQPAAAFTYGLSVADSTNYLHCITAQEGTSPPSCNRWTLLSSPAGSRATLKCIANDPVGNVTESFFDARGRLVLHREFAGRATPGDPVTDTVNRPTGKLRSSDPDYYETRWSWNNDSLCTAEISPGGQQVRCVYQSDFDPATPARKRADLRVVHELAAAGVDLDGDGVADVTDRTWRCEYDPRFGSDPTASLGKKLYVGNLPFRVNDSAAGEGVLSNTRQRVLDIENVLKNLGLLSRASQGKRCGIGDTSPACPLGRFGRPAINTALNNSLAGLIPDGNGVAIKTKGTGAEANRVTFGREKLKATTKTQGDFNLSNRSFVTAATDPRGNVNMANYDAKGNPSQMTISTSSCGANAPTVNLAYDSHGQLTAITNLPDANCSRRVDTFTWSQGQLTQCVVDAGGLAISSAFEYDARGNLTRCVDPRTNDWLFAYNALDQLVQSSSATLSLCFCKIKVDYAYDANDDLVQCATDLLDAAGTMQGKRTDNFHYDSRHRLTEIALAVDATHALTNRFVYDGNGQCVQGLGGDAVSGADPHQTVAYEYDERGLLFRAITAPGSSLTATNEFGYNANGDTVVAGVHTIDGLESETDFAYDGFGRPATLTDAMGNQTVCFHDANDNLGVVRQFGELSDVPGSGGNVRLTESRYEYDGLDRCVVAHELHFAPATQTPVGDGECTTRIAFAPCGQCRGITDDWGQVTSFDYDTAGRVYRIRVPNDKALRVCTLDPCGNVASVVQTDTPDLGGPAQVFSVTNVYDALNRGISSTDSAGNTSTCAYDSLDNPVSTVDARGNETVFAYDYLRRCVQTTCYQGKERGLTINTSHVEYRLNSSGFSATDANSNTTLYTCDSLDRLVAVTNADGTHRTLVWSPRSNLLSEQDANGNVSVNTYDRNDRLIRRDIAARFETFTYDGCDRLTGHQNNDCGGSFTYDSHGNCVQETLNGLATTSAYDALGNRLSLTYPGGRALTYGYDANSRCTNITESGAALASFAYNGVTRLVRVTYGNGTRTKIGYDGLTSAPNAPGDYGFRQVSRVRHELTANSVAIDDRTFHFDPAQNKTSRDLTAPFTLAGVARAQAFQYDPACRLVASLVTTNGGQDRLVDYGLDRMGNRTNVTGAACFGNYTMDSAAPPADFQMNQYTTTGCDARTYDDNGNLVARVSPVGPVTYQYDYADRLVLVQALDSGTGTLAPVASYAYDALGRRATKTVYSGGATHTMQFSYDGGNVVETREDGVVADSFVHSVDDRSLLGLRHHDQNYFVHADDQGNALALTGTGGAVVERYDYDDYGAVTLLTIDGIPTSATASAYGNVYCWGGLRLDAETGLLNDDGGGYFEPLTGRAVRGKVKIIKDMGVSHRAFDGNNPWSTGGGEVGPVEMKHGVVKFFNETKGFGFIKEENGQESKHYITIPHNLSHKHYITIPHNLSRSLAASLVENLTKKKDYVGHVTLMK